MIRDAARSLREGAPIGPAGAFARAAVGLTLIALALFWRDPTWLDALLGLAVAPAIVIAALWLRSAYSPKPLRATGPVGHVLNLAVVLVGFMLPLTAGPTFLFYGTSMLAAAARRSGGCEVTTIANLVLRRNDQVGCLPFAPVDLTEAALRRHGSAGSQPRTPAGEPPAPPRRG